MKSHFVLFILLCLLSNTRDALGISHYYHAVNYHEELSHPDVKSIYQDSYGFMWFGTKNKLNRFDGITTRSFDCYDNKLDIRNNNISSIAEDNERRMWLATDNGVFIFDPIKERFHFFDTKTDRGDMVGQWVADIQRDWADNMWIVVPNQGVFKYSTEDNSLKLYQVVDKFILGVDNIESITISDEGQIWLGSNGSGAYLYDEEKDSFEQYLGDKGSETLLDKNIYTITSHGHYIIAGIHEESIMILDSRINVVKTVRIPQIDHSIIRDIAVYDSFLWIATQSGVYSIKIDKSNLMMPALSSYTLSDKYIECIYRDNEGGMWIGTRFGGVNLLPNHGNIFEVYDPIAQKVPNASNRLKELLEDSYGNIWVGTEDAGLLKFDTQTNRFQSTQTQTDHKQVLALMQKGNDMWVGHFKAGLDVLSINNNKVTHYDVRKLGMNEESLFALEEDSDGDVWLGNAWGVYLLKKGTFTFQHMVVFGSAFTHDIHQDKDGYIWVATMGNGIIGYDKKTSAVRHFTTNSGENLRVNTISSISEDSKGRLWFSTDRGGLNKYDKTLDQFTSYSIEQGLPDDITYKVLEDENHELWFGTNNGLVKFNPETEQVRVYTERDGLPTNRFNYNSGLVSRSGKLYMGSMAGLIAFEPHRFKKNQFMPSVHITQLSVMDNVVSPNSKYLPIENSIQHTNEITLQYNQSNIKINFASLSYNSPVSNTYAYKLEGVDNEWIYTKDNYAVSYANLLPGEYIFSVKGTNNDGMWSDNESALVINVLPPWWKSTWAYLLYFCLLLACMYLLIRIFLMRNKKKNIEKQRIFEAQKEKELYESKIEFFTEIAHEIRTPVTLINGPLESIMDAEINDEGVQYNLGIIKRNTNLLLDLINRLLDFRKVDNKKFNLHIVNSNIVDLLYNTYHRFEGQVKVQTLQCDFHIAQLEVVAEIDKEAMDKILNNLLSNAIKYTAKTISISLTADDKNFTLAVSNDGALISDEYRSKIFDPFFRVRSAEQDVSGTGLGLSLAKSLAELLHGQLYYDAKDGKNNFYLKIPLEYSDDYQSENLSASYSANIGVKQENPLEEILSDFLHTPEYKKTILLVEDNVDMLQFLKNELENYYELKTATDGNQAMEVLAKEQVDIVITDVMMPNKNGFELCEYIKGDKVLSDLTVVLLTAKSDVESKIHALKAGADAYVEKPFSIRYLVTLLNTLEQNKQKVMDTYLERPFLPLQKAGLNKADTLFLEKATEIINKNITDANFNVERLAELLNLSRSSLHRKMKETIDFTPTDFIRLVRLQKATQYINDGEYRINEICYLVGINSPSYFTKLFQSQYNMTPKEYKDSRKD